MSDAKSLMSGSGAQTISVFAALRKGAQAVWASKRMALAFLLLNLLSAVFITLPVVSLVNDSLSTSLYSERLMFHFEIFWLQDLIYKHHDAFVSVVPLLVAGGIVYIIINVFLTGGSLGTFSSGEAFSVRRFFEHALSNFSIVSRMVALSFIFYATALFLYVIVTSGLAAVISGGASTEKSHVLVDWSQYIMLFFLLSLVNMWFDYAKVRGIADRAQGAVKESWLALKFVLGHKGKTLGLYYLLLAVQLTVTLLGLYLVRRLPQGSFLLIAVAFIVQELFVLLRIMVRLTTFSSQTALYQSSRMTP